MAKGAKHHFRLGLGLNGKNKIQRKEADEWGDEKRNSGLSEKEKERKKECEIEEDG